MLVSPRLPQQARSRAKRKRLLEAALVLFDERGFDAATVDAIAERAGVSVGIFYRYFRSKEQTLLTLTEERLAEIRLNLAEVHTAPLRVVLLEQRLRAFLVRDRQFIGLRRARQELLLRRPELARLEQEQFDALSRELAANIEQGRVSGLLRPDLDAAAASVTILLLAVQLRSLLPLRTDEQLAPIIRAAAQMIYHALAPD
ncbi:MAG TPA: helix-turn-helix domain-containing protein [Chloroflexota bacterium]|nr:helix-turn-helix domain-containing protein [Chloroflexota bacterium]